MLNIVLFKNAQLSDITVSVNLDSSFTCQSCSTYWILLGLGMSQTKLKIHKLGMVSEFYL